MPIVTGSAGGQIQVSQTGAGILSSTKLPIEVTLKALLNVSGLLADQIDLVHARTYAFTASTPQTLNLQSLTDPFGQAQSFARIKALAIIHKGQVDASFLRAGPAASNGWNSAIGGGTNPYVEAKPSTTTNPLGGGILLLAPGLTGYPVSGSIRDLLLTPSAHAFSADVVILGCTA